MDQKWISCAERLPEVGVLVVACTREADETSYVVARLSPKLIWLDRHSREIKEQVLCWFRIPKVE